MKTKIKINGKIQDFHFDIYLDKKYKDLLYPKVMSNKDENNGGAFPIPFEEDRINFINSVYNKDKRKFSQLKQVEIDGLKYFVIDSVKRVNLHWLFRESKTISKNQMYKREKKKKESGEKINKNNRNKADIFNDSTLKTLDVVSQEKLKKKKKTTNHKMKWGKALKDPGNVNLFMMPREERRKLSHLKPKKVSIKKNNKHIDAMDYRVPGSFGTGKS